MLTDETINIMMKIILVAVEHFDRLNQTFALCEKIMQIVIQGEFFDNQVGN